VGKSPGARVVEAHTVDNRTSGGCAKHPGRRVAWLRLPGNSTQFAEAKTQLAPNRNGGGKFVHARRQAHGIGKSEAENFCRQFRRRKKITQKAAKRRILAKKRKSF
jgi:hypothetical protein